MPAKSKTRVTPPRNNYYTFHGAGILSDSIEWFWKRRGFEGVRTERFLIPGCPGHYGVRSNLVGGLPPRIEADKFAAAR